MIFRRGFQKLKFCTERSRSIKYLALGILFALLTGLQISLVSATVTTTIPNERLANSATTLVQTAKEKYQLGQFNEAIALWRKALDLFTQKQDRLNQSAILTNIALGYEQLGQWSEANSAISQSLDLLISQKSAKPEKDNLLIQALNVQGSLQLSQGQPEQALTAWEKAADISQKMGDRFGVNRSLLNQTQALRAMGFYPRAKKILELLVQNLQTQPDSLLKLTSLLNLGDTLRVMGITEKSAEILQQSLAIAQKLNSPNEIALALLGLGNNFTSQGKPQKALDYYQQVITTSDSPTLKLQAQMNQLGLLGNTQELDKFFILLPQVQHQIENLPPSRTNIYSRVNFAQILQKVFSVKQPNTGELVKSVAQILATAVQQARNLGDRRAESYSLGSLGGLYEYTKQWSEAEKLTSQALVLSQVSNAPEISYLWQWQLGRIFQGLGNIEQAIAADNEAIKTSSYIRQDLVAGNNNLQFSFQESVEPIYRELVGLLLQPQTAQNGKDGRDGQDVSQTNLKKAQDLIESLKVAELDNYFREDCLTGKVTKVEQLDATAAVIYPIMLSDRLEIVLSLVNQPLQHFAVDIPKVKLEELLNKLRHSLVLVTSGKKQRIAISQQVYDLLIRPTETELASHGIKTLVFVLDGLMKNVPMAALYDGEKYLIEKYAIAQTPGLKLLSSQPLQKQPLRLLAGAITESRQDFSALPGVAEEINGINSEIPTKVLFNQTFTTKNIQKFIQANPFPIVHLATHGKFSSKVEDTFILTWDGRLNVKDLGELLQSRDQDTNAPIELLVLSACQTAKGDKRAPLGIAGVAVKSGARSTIANLWSVNDESAAKFMVEFYHQLAKSKVSKAEAVRLAQLKLLKEPRFDHPFYWSPFVLIGNWL
jgi:CHAT domain-containing protein